MKIIKILIVALVGAASIYFTNLQLKPLFIENAHIKAQKTLNSTLQLSEKTILRGIEKRKKELLQLAGVIEKKKDIDVISGILSGNLTKFLWMEYVDDRGVSKILVGKKGKAFVLGTNLKNGYYLESGVDLKSFLKSGKSLVFVDNIEKNIKKIVKKSDTYVSGYKLIGSTGWYVAIKVPVMPMLSKLYVVDALLAILSLLAILFVIFSSSNKDVVSIANFLEMFLKNNKDLRFDVTEKDPLFKIKNGINLILDKFEQEINLLKEKDEKLESFLTYIPVLSNEIVVKNIFSKMKFFIENQFDLETKAFVKVGEDIILFDNEETIVKNPSEKIVALFDEKENRELTENIFSADGDKSENDKKYFLFPVTDIGFFIINVENDFGYMEKFIDVFKTIVISRSERMRDLKAKVSLNKMLDRLNIGVMKADKNGKVEFSNKTLKDILGISTLPENAQLVQIFNSFGIELSLLSEALNEKKIVSREMFIAGRAINFTVVPIPISNNGEFDILLLFEDITKWKKENERIAKELIESKEKCDNLNKSVSDLQTLVSRLNDEKVVMEGKIRELSKKEDIVLPKYLETVVKDASGEVVRMSKILSMLSEKIAKSEHAKYVELAKKELSHLNFMIKNLMIVKEDINSEKQRGDFNNIVKRVYDFFKLFFKKKNMTIKASLDKEIAAFEFDKVNIGLIVYNMMKIVEITLLEGTEILIVSNKTDNGIKFFIKYDAAFPLEIPQTIESVENYLELLLFASKYIANGVGAFFEISESEEKMVLELKF